MYVLPPTIGLNKTVYLKRNNSVYTGYAGKEIGSDDLITCDLYFYVIGSFCDHSSLIYYMIRVQAVAVWLMFHWYDIGHKVVHLDSYYECNTRHYSSWFIPSYWDPISRPETNPPADPYNYDSRPSYDIFNCAAFSLEEQLVFNNSFGLEDCCHNNMHIYDHFVIGYDGSVRFYVDPCISPPSWQLGNSYDICDFVDNNDVCYSCFQDHTANSDNQPGVGVDWGDYWSIY